MGEEKGGDDKISVIQLHGTFDNQTGRSVLSNSVKARRSNGKKILGVFLGKKDKRYLQSLNDCTHLQIISSFIEFSCKVT